MPALGKHYAATGFTGERSLDDRLDQPALGQVVGGRDQAVARRGGEYVGQQPLPLEVDLRRQAAEVVGGDLGPDRAVELVTGVAEQDQGLAGLVAESRSGMRRLTSSITPSTPTTGVGRIAVVPVWL